MIYSFLQLRKTAKLYTQPCKFKYNINSHMIWCSKFNACLFETRCTCPSHCGAHHMIHMVFPHVNVFKTWRQLLLLLFSLLISSSTHLLFFHFFFLLKFYLCFVYFNWYLKSLLLDFCFSLTDIHKSTHMIISYWTNSWVL